MTVRTRAHARLRVAAGDENQNLIERVKPGITEGEEERNLGGTDLLPTPESQSSVKSGSNIKSTCRCEL